jgi:hypothetical protein
MKTTIHNPKEQVYHYLHLARRYAAVVLLVFLSCIYGFLAWRILVLSQAQPDASAVSSELKTVGVPKVDEDVVSKMQKLEDNSVSVQTLFDQARSNPFGE